MAEPIICPVCGESNPADMEFCRNCQSRLLPLTGALKGEDAPIHPGQIPTKKVTSELEPILPEWLREARKQARQSAQEESTISGEIKQTKPLPEVPDLLAGLASQNENEDEADETPDWVTGITGAPARKKKNEPESSQVKWVELGHNDEPPKAAATEESHGAHGMARQAPAPEKDELTEWFKQATGTSPAPDEKLEFTKAEAPAPIPSEKPATFHPAPFDTNASDVFIELDTGASDSQKESVAPAPAFDTEIPDWIKKLDSEAPAVSQQPPPPKQDTKSPAAIPADVPDWLKGLGQEPAVPQPSEPARDELLPDWLKTAGPSNPEEPAAVEAQPVADRSPDLSEVPDWIASLKSSGQQGSKPKEPAADQSQPVPEKQPDKSELPDWITSLKSAGSQGSETGEPAESVFQPDQPTSTEPTPAASAFTEPPDQSNDVDAIFASMQIPDWLSDVTLAKPAADENPAPAAQAEEPIAPAELPSWVQAMRPVESAMSSTSAGPVDTRLEEQGALAGLHGVLPIIPGATEATSKPKSQSIKLDTTDQQQAHVALLEQILSAETAPVPMRSDSLLRSQRLLRWSLSALLFIVLGGVVFGRTQIFPLPSYAPNETNAAIQAVEAIPDAAPVLVVFDYEPATVGEMEASGAPLLDHLRLLKNPRFTLLSTSPTGAALAERFMLNVLANPNSTPPYLPVAGNDYIDLGYLPGGLAGVYDFAQDPTGAMPLNADSTLAWDSKLLQGVTHLSDFKAVIVLTDSVDAGRIWIEQTELARGNTPLIMVSSAQAGPMFLPYVQSGQVVGLVDGLYGAAGAEQVNGGLPSITAAQQAKGVPQVGYVRRYWDAYSLGLLLVAAVMSLGGLWNFWLGVQDRRIHEAG